MEGGKVLWKPHRVFPDLMIHSSSSFRQYGTINNNSSQVGPVHLQAFPRRSTPTLFIYRSLESCPRAQSLAQL